MDSIFFDLPDLYLPRHRTINERRFVFFEFFNFGFLPSGVFQWRLLRLVRWFGWAYQYF